MSVPAWASGLRGVSVGDRWRWSDPERPNEGETRWGVLWNRNLGEIVAVQLIDGAPGRVLLLGTIHRKPDRTEILTWLEKMAHEHMAQPDGLMALAWAIDALPANG
jgi:hypothetical protein